LDGRFISNDRWIGWHLAAISNSQFLTGSSSNDQAYGFVDVQKEYRLKKEPITSEIYWMDSPYTKIGGTSSDGYWQEIMDTEYYSPKGVNFISRFNLTHMMENTKTYGRWSSHHGYQPSIFVKSLYDESNPSSNIFDNGRLKIWTLKK
jgi:hypothetical protein